MRSVADIAEEYEFLDRDDRWRMLIELGESLEPMPEALKSAQTKVAGCASDVWVYPLPATEERGLHFLADSNSAFTKGIVALVIAAVQDEPAAKVANMDIRQALAPFDLKNQFTSQRTQGVPNMIALVQQHAARIAARPPD
ncbi:SufE family protein [Tsuneonella sp. HG249]